MDKSRWVCILVVGLYAIVFLAFPLSDGEPVTGLDHPRSSSNRYVGGFLLFLGFVCVWWSGILGDALWMGHGAWNPQPSSAGVVKLLGWIFLIGAFIVHVILWRQMS
ncbi:MAG: hypothetical protein RBR19_09365 [Sedimentisphaerales bacterium]|jgi:hypothetical protein|nr:hypothetical protein [Planctomycetota bacterium]MDY0356073.1 hypothetical protein [Sedimentisphaerales bacterium]NLT76670.1 hypothetical protein [Planctomycetota bacterium]